VGVIHRHKPVLLIAAVTSRHGEAIQWATRQMSAAWDDISLKSELFDFEETDFYRQSMGSQLKKQLFAFNTLLDPANIAQSKLLANNWEDNYKSQSSHPEIRPLNIDPGYITEAKLVLATTKDRDHRIYLAHGIFAEVTLHFQEGKWQSARWTYPDYQRHDYHEFFIQCRELLRKKYRESIS
jgi:hypothetical protein